MEVQGTITEIMAKEVISDKFSKREFVVKTDETYPQLLLIQAVNSNIDKLNTVKIGDNVEVKINLRGRKYEKNGKVSYFNSIECWQISVVGAYQQTAQPSVTSDEADTEFGDLPF